MKSAIFVICALAVATVSGKKISELTVKTSAMANAGTNALIGVAIFTAESADHCRIDHLANVGANDFEMGQTDSFSGAQLMDCRGFDFPSDATFMTVTMYGNDGWAFENWRIFFDDGSLSTCTNGNPTWVDDTDGERTVEVLCH